MAMTTTEQNTFNQALQNLPSDIGVQLRVTDAGSGTGVYVLYRKVPIQVMTIAQFTAFATAMSVTVASP